MAVWSEALLSKLAGGLRIDAEYYHPRHVRDGKRLAATNPLPIGQFAFVTDGIHASPDEVDEGGVRYLSAKCVKDNDFALGGAIQISQKQHAANPRTSLRENDVLITTVGTIGNAAVVQADLLPANSDRHLGIIRLKEDAPVDPYFLATFLNCEFGRFQSLREATGNVQLNLFIEKIRELLVPELSCRKQVSKLTQDAYAKRREAADDMAEAEERLTSTLGLQGLDLSDAKCYSRRFSDLIAAGRYGAEYFMPSKGRALAALAKGPHRPLGDLVANIRDMWDPTGAGASPVRNYDVTDALEPFLDDTQEPSLATDIGSSKKTFRSGDVVISRLRSYLREIAVVRASGDIPTVGSSEFIVLRPNKDGMSPEALLVFLRSRVVQTILKWSQDGSNHPRFTEEDLLAVPVPSKLITQQRPLRNLVEAAIDARRQAASLLGRAKQMIERAIVETSAA